MDKFSSLLESNDENTFGFSDADYRALINYKPKSYPNTELKLREKFPSASDEDIRTAAVLMRSPNADTFTTYDVISYLKGKYGE